MTEPAFNLRALVQKVLDTSGATEPRELANEVFDLMEPHHHEDVVRQLLPGFVESLIGANRRASMPTFTAPASTKTTGMVGKSYGQRMQESGTWLRWMKEIDKGVDGVSKRVGKMTIEDLYAAAKRRDELASRNGAAARNYRALINLCDEHGVTVVEDLPAEVLAKFN